MKRGQLCSAAHFTWDTHSSRRGRDVVCPGQDWLGLGRKPNLEADSPPWTGKETSSRLSTAFPGSTEHRDCVAYGCNWAWRSAEEPAMASGVFGGSGSVSKGEGASGPASNGVGLGWGQARYLPPVHPGGSPKRSLPCSVPQTPAC